MNEAVSNINFIGSVFLAIMVILILFLPRRFAVVPILMTACYMTLGQVVVIGPFHFTMMRILIFLGCLRAFIGKGFNTIKINSIDKIVVAYVLASTIIYFLLRKDTEAFVNGLGFIYNALGLYFLFRYYIRDDNDCYSLFKILALLMAPLACAMLMEKITGRNFFSIFGGVPEFTVIREGRLRAQGAFSHPILAGTFGATCIPLFIALWVKDNTRKIIVIIGLVSATIITVTPSSSGPVMAYAVVIIGLFMWRLRDNMRMIRWIALFIILALHMVMKAPVWALIGKIGSVIGGGGWHRVMLIDAAIEHFREWWLLGTDYTLHWMPTGVTWSARHTDITNYFIGIGVRGGLLSLILFISILVLCFKNIGLKIKELDAAESPLKFTLWCLGVSLSAHIASFVSVSYFDQIIVYLYFLLAMIVSLTVNQTKMEDSQLPKEL